MIRVCYLWEMGLMVKTAGLEQIRQKRLRELAERRQRFEERYEITEHDEEELSKCGPIVQSTESAVQGKEQG